MKEVKEVMEVVGVMGVMEVMEVKEVMEELVVVEVMGVMEVMDVMGVQTLQTPPLNNSRKTLLFMLAKAIIIRLSNTYSMAAFKKPCKNKSLTMNTLVPSPSHTLKARVTCE